MPHCLGFDKSEFFLLKKKYSYQIFTVPTFLAKTIVICQIFLLHLFHSLCLAKLAPDLKEDVKRVVDPSPQLIVDALVN